MQYMEIAVWKYAVDSSLFLGNIIFDGESYIQGKEYVFDYHTRLLYTFLIFFILDCLKSFGADAFATSVLDTPSSILVGSLEDEE